MSAPKEITPRYLTPVSRDLTVLDLVAPAEPEDLEWALHAHPIVDGERQPSLLDRLVAVGPTLGTKERRKVIAIWLEEYEEAGADEDVARGKIVTHAVNGLAERIHEPQAVRWGSGRGSRYEGGTSLPVHVPADWLGITRPTGDGYFELDDSVTETSLDKGVRRVEHLVFDGIKTFLDGMAGLVLDADRLDRRDGGNERQVQLWKDREKAEGERIERLVATNDTQKIRRDINPSIPPVETLPGRGLSAIEAEEFKLTILQTIDVMQAKLPTERYLVLLPVYIGRLTSLAEGRLEKLSKKEMVQRWGPDDLSIDPVRRFDYERELLEEEHPEVAELCRELVAA